MGLLMVLLILAAQYERWSLPLAVGSAVPFAVLGAVLAGLFRNYPNDIYFQVGLLVLIGLAAKKPSLSSSLPPRTGNEACPRPKPP